MTKWLKPLAGHLTGWGSLALVPHAAISPADDSGVRRLTSAEAVEQKQVE